ncbi:MAG TPA: AAA family ATPase, partial [Kofleriaceae bacterium]
MRGDDSLQLPGYASVEQLYTGARSTVYRAQSSRDGRRVVLKLARSGAAMLDESLARLRHEMAILTAIRSERVVRAIDVVRIGDDAALVLEDFGGESLDRYLARARFSLADTLGLAIGVVAALRDVHAAGIIHKDVTPSNIVYNAATGQARLIDFDIATAWRTERHGFVPPSTLEGTLLYMAPEQTGRMNRIIDSRADLYAFGVTLFELLTGQLPFADGDLLSIVHAHVAVRAPTPDEIDPAIPRPVAAIVNKLLAKAPEDRYQTAAGLFADLRTCVERFAVTGAIAEFALGRDDVASRFELPTKLYGRRAELEALTGAFERVATGAVEAVLVTGHSGVGKTSIVRELFPLITRERGRFVTGKFDQLHGDAPYPALVAALDGLIHQLLTESEDALARWRDQIVTAIAPNAQVVIDSLPALERILGPQPPVIELDAAGTQSRFVSTLQHFLQVFTRRSHPLVVFLDDLQWADPESVQLLEAVALSDATESLLLIGAYRDGEVADGHPVAAAANELAKHRRVTRLAVAPLPIDDVAALVADALHREPAAVAALAQLVCRKTDGNPFFVRQLLLALHEAGHIAFDTGHGWFGFDAQAIERAPISENVADLLADNLRKLPESTRRVLAIAAAFGNRFEVDLLALIAEDSPAAIQAELAATLGGDLVVPLSELEYLASPRGAGLVFRRLRFQHDRVQRAAYALMSPDEAQRMHLRIGRLLLASAPPDELGDRLFDVVSHWNRAVALLDPAEHKQLARLDAQAARKARSSAAYAAAIEFLRVAVAGFDWNTDYADQLDAHTMLAECCYLGGDPRRAAAVIDEAEVHVVHSRDRGTLEALRATLHIHAGDMAAALRATRAAA